MTHLNFVHLIMTYNYKSFFMLSGIWKLQINSAFSAEIIKFFSGILQRCSLEIEFASQEPNEMFHAKLHISKGEFPSHLCTTNMTCHHDIFPFQTS